MVTIIKKTLLYLVLITNIIGCYYNGRVSEYGLPRKEIKRLIKPISYQNIDTLALYKLTINYHYDNLSKEFTYFEKYDNNSYSYTSYLKFYNGGKLGLFIIPRNDTLKLDRSMFNPAKAKMGYYWLDGILIKTRIATIGDGSLFVNNKKGKIKGDTIDLQDKTHHGNIYIKKKIPKELLENWKPDW